MSIRETSLAPGQLSPSVDMEKSYLGKRRLPCAEEGVIRFLKLPWGKERIM